MHNFPNTMPAVRRRMDEDTIARLRAAEGQIDDEHDADRDYGAEAVREDFGLFRGLLSWPSLLIVSIVAAALIAAFWQHK
jgi:hypothetical protein